MKKVEIITIFDNTNFGTYLQALALALTIQKSGFDVEIIDYIRPVQSEEVWKRFGNNFIKKIYYTFWGFPHWRKLRCDCHAFVSHFVPISKTQYMSYKELKDNPPLADIYITGSDQVWNSIYNGGIDKSFYLDFVPDGYKRVAYAASIGMSQIPKEEVEEMKRLLSKYKSITVREADAHRILSELGFKNVPVVLDPTLLLDKVAWASIAKQFKPLKTEPYLLVYSVESDAQNKLISRYAKLMSKRYGWKIYEISYNSYFHRLKFADRHFSQVTPEVFLQLMLNAEFVIVSSFHGTAFSINFNKQFLTISPNRFNSRVDNILAICDLKDRLVTSSSFDINKIHSIDYSRVNNIIEKERNKSMNLLNEMLVVSTQKQAID